MDKNSVLYQLMDLRMNDVMNGIVIKDEDYISENPEEIKQVL